MNKLMSKVLVLSVFITAFSINAEARRRAPSETWCNHFQVLSNSYWQQGDAQNSQHYSNMFYGSGCEVYLND